MTIKPEQLERDIEAIPGVCKDAKEAIKKLFENNFEVKFKKPEPEFDFVVGGVYQNHYGKYVLIGLENRQYLTRSLEDFRSYWGHLLSNPASKEDTLKGMINGGFQLISRSVKSHYNS